MPHFDIDPISIDFEVNYPNISFDIDFVVPNWVPNYSGTRYHIWSGSISYVNPEIQIPIEIDGFAGVSGTINIALDFSRSSISVSGSVNVFGFSTTLGPVLIPYATTIVFPPASWSGNTFTLDPATLQAKINAASGQNTGTSQGATGLRNDPDTQQQLRSLFEFFGAGNFIDEMINSMQSVGRPQKPRLVPTNTEAMLTENFDTDMLVAFAANMGGGAVASLSGAYGIYFTTVSGDWGTFGSVSIGAGFIAELALNIVGFCYWAEGGKTAKENFNGLNFFAAIEAGDPVSVGLTFYWPEDSILHISDKSPCGIGFGLGGGIGLPLNVYVGNSDTILNAHAPSQTTNSFRQKRVSRQV